MTTLGDAFRMIAVGLTELAAAVDAQASARQPEDGDRLTLQDLSRRYRVSVRRARRAIASGELAATRPGREYLVSAAAVTAWLGTHASTKLQVPPLAPTHKTQPDAVDELIRRELSAGRLRSIRGGR